MIRSLGVLFGTALTLVAIFVPKIISIYHHLKTQEDSGHGRGGGERSTSYTGTYDTSEIDDSSLGDDDRPQFYSDNVIRKSSNNSSNR